MTTAMGACGWNSGFPAGGLIGWRSEFLTDIRGTIVMSAFLTGKRNGWVKSRVRLQVRWSQTGPASQHHMPPYDLWQRGELLVGAGTEVNEGMIVGETSRRKRSRRQRRAPMRRSASSQTGR